MKRALLVALLLTAIGGPLAAQRVAIEFLADGELWKTDAGSRLLARNEGELAAQARVRTWLALRPARALELLTHVMVEGGNAQDEAYDAYLEQLELRATPFRGLIVEAGKILQPIGAFGARRFSNTNPLIGEPDAYPAQYPWGAVVGGRIGVVDYRLALTSLPSVNVRYSPEPDHRLRPVAGLGINVGPALRVGVGATHGSYLGDDVSAQLPAGRSWEEYQQTVISTDVRLGVGYVEARAEVVWSAYDVPTQTDQLRGLGWYAEVRGTVSPRVFVAGRFEHYRYAFILPVNPSFWVARETTQMNGEVGIGYRVNAALLVKTSVRLDHWPVHNIPGTDPFPDGHAFAVQLSLLESLTDLLTGRY